MSDLGSLGQLPPKWGSNVDEMCRGHFAWATWTHDAEMEVLKFSWVVGNVGNA